MTGCRTLHTLACPSTLTRSAVLIQHAIPVLQYEDQVGDIAISADGCSELYSNIRYHDEYSSPRWSTVKLIYIRSRDTLGVLGQRRLVLCINFGLHCTSSRDCRKICTDTQSEGVMLALCELPSLAHGRGNYRRSNTLTCDEKRDHSHDCVSSHCDSRPRQPSSLVTRVRHHSYEEHWPSNPTRCLIATEHSDMGTIAACFQHGKKITSFNLFSGSGVWFKIALKGIL
ncbi:uncharacterized protein C8Q71DRAFT_355165 [Rhodofomes roseus]|uniref:Uncharacterized protein n=1 Tax=Rhodofomes roseus TaxID=34475 RepID=A0ABQ8KV23_9APHY|nr:uncharacterized protein C8Q71DRAFT_355165 [Rhodofomes roseus]KAH9841931.1 hypothetical protein C8Q71DRAFT_355165 [Rhodofomes roseus]